ncbi:DNA polymerase III subunit alpha [Aequorivita sinensis]|uniref:hypothetical protein n=1 Tax=Aequorivita sinensis TaxID=1382458 RepID=UPI001121814C|nr:hypothetical protein [Aequorivita sinensis]
MSEMNTPIDLGSWEEYQENYPKSKLHRLPDFPVPSRYENDYNGYLKVLAFEGAVKRYGVPLPRKVTERLESELLEIRSEDNERFFLIISDMIQEVKRMGFFVEYDGSFKDFLLCYVLNMNDIDPLKYGLSNILGSPINTIFFSVGGKAKVMEYLIKKYGTESIWHTAAHSDNRTTSIDPSSIAIVSKTLKSFFPVLFSKKEEREVCLIQRNTLERLGLPMFRLFDLNKNTFLSSQIIKNRSIKLDLTSIPLNDSRFLEDVVSEKATDFDPLVQKLVIQLQPTTIEHLAVLFSMPSHKMQVKLLKYIALKNGTKPVKYLLPEMESILGETYGLIIYREQLMLLAQKLANFSKNDSGEFYKNIRFKPIQNQFIEGCVANGYSLKVCEKIIKKIGKEGYPVWSKYRAVLQAATAYQMMWLKAHYPEEFNNEINKQNKEEI